MSSVWNRIREAWGRVGSRTRSVGDASRTAAARERFWADVREGEREAAEASRS